MSDVLSPRTNLDHANDGAQLRRSSLICFNGNRLPLLASGATRRAPGMRVRRIRPAVRRRRFPSSARSHQEPCGLPVNGGQRHTTRTQASLKVSGSIVTSNAHSSPGCITTGGFPTIRHPWPNARMSWKSVAPRAVNVALRVISRRGCCRLMVNIQPGMGRLLNRCASAHATIMNVAIAATDPRSPSSMCADPSRTIPSREGCQ